ncbi:MAG: hypothetical protein KatS3mg080_0589 [Anoxybacillus sp.]|nr:MAG: hypothetical protein KatS3mg080_0589 [Anoxybacillus sp.]
MLLFVHILVMQWSDIAAWIVTFFDVYFLLFLIADYRAKGLPRQSKKNEVKVLGCVYRFKLSFQHISS